MASENYTLNMGNGDAGQNRRASYETAASKQGKTLAEWIKAVCDAAAKSQLKEKARV